MTDLIFKMEQLDEDFVGSTWVEGAAIKEDAAPASEIATQQQAAIDGTEADKKLEPIRNREPKGRPQRPLPLRQRQEVQELLHASKRDAARSRRSESPLSSSTRDSHIVGKESPRMDPESCLPGCSTSSTWRCIAVASPLIVWQSLRTGKYREGFREKLLGLVPRRDGDATCVWLHAVSVGEVNLLATLLRELRAAHPDWQFVVSTTSRTGYELARKKYADLTRVLLPARFQLGRAAARCVAFGRRCWCWPSWSCGRT